MTQEPGHFDYMQDMPPKNIDDIHNLIRWSKNCNRKNTPDKIYKFNLSVFLKETGEYIGISGLGPSDVNHNEVELYYSLMKAHQGKGYAKEAAAAVLAYGLETIGLTKVVGIVHPKNLPSLNIMEGLGLAFSHEITGQEGDLQGLNGYMQHERRG